MGKKQVSISSDRAVPLPVFSEQYQQRLKARLSRIEGQVRGVSRMLEAQRRCPEVLQQLASIQAALRGVSHEVFRNYLEQCVATAVRSGDSDIYDELMVSLKRFNA